MPDDPIALEAYETLAEHFAAHVDTKPHNAYYERPATLSLLPDVSGLRLLDAGCGPGAYADILLTRGAAHVTGLDLSPRMIALAQARLGERFPDRVTLQQADLNQPLDFLPDGGFDGILSPLVLSYLPTWDGVLAEFHRVLRPGGWLVCSFGHPMSDHLQHPESPYFATELVEEAWSGPGGGKVTVPHYRRPLGTALNAFLEAGFNLERLLEPQPTEIFREADPAHYAALMQRPLFLCLRVRKG